MIFDINNIESIKETLKTSLNYPFVSVQHSTLGGDDSVSILVTVATSLPNTWHNGIFENSTYVKLHIKKDGTVEHFSGTKMKLRKKTVTSIDDAIKHINNNMQIAIIPDDYNYFTNNKITWRYLKDGV